MLRTLLIILAVPVAAYGALALTVGRDRVWPTLLGPGDRAPIDFATLRLPSTPNHHLVCPPGVCPAGGAPAPEFPVPAERLRAEVLRLLERDGAAVADREAETIEAVVRTRFLRFPDRAAVRVLPLGPERSTLAVYSRSVYGYADMGTNARRVNGWLTELERTLR